MQFIDNLLALRIVYLLTVPFNQTDAFKLGLIDAEGKQLKKAKTTDEKNATNMLFRLVWNLKKVFALVPYGDTRIGQLAAAYLLVKESLEFNHTEEQALQHFNENFDRVWGLPFKDKDLIEDMIRSLDETMVTGASVSTDVPTIKGGAIARRNRRFAEFNVDNTTYDKFRNGKTKYRKWADYLNLEDESHAQIRDFARKNPHGIIVIKSPTGEMKGIRYSRNGSGNWAQIGRKKQLAESNQTLILDPMIEEIEIQQINL